jgi:uncharacterized damage-inducible protein DinB
MNPVEAKAAGTAMTTLWESEFKATMQVIAAVKDDNRSYKPDPKSRTAFELAMHLAMADVWFADCIAAGKFQWDQDAVKKAEDSFKSVDQVVEYYKKAFPASLQALRGLSGEQLAEPLDFFGNFTLPRAQAIGFANNHSVHHRGQLAAYLRPLGSRVPDIYGPSADTKSDAN